MFCETLLVSFLKWAAIFRMCKGIAAMDDLKTIFWRTVEM